MQQHGFTLLREEKLSEIASTTRLWRHEATGAALLSVLNNDENKVFGVSFRTPPSDSTGVAHILEHSVLCGSEKYPVKEPFVELLKGSLQTFLNAFTYPDKTCYPVASANLKDFRNLTDVYLDAVFFPRITEEIFQQEGWHLDPGEKGRFAYKGVVYNEMKGAFSSPDSVLARYSLHALFPDTVYALESGGDPGEIPSLSYEAFRNFHARFYHPSNARFFYWGDDDEGQRLEQLGGVLSRFTRLEPDSSIALQPRIDAPRTLTVPFAASEEEKGIAVLNWLGPDVMDVELVLAFRMLEHILLGMPASPLRRTLIESGLGEDLAGQGLETELRQLTFDAGLKGIAPEDAPKVEALILSTLEGLVKEGIAESMIEAAINTVEFTLRENNTGSFPVGLAVMLRALSTWLHEGDPLAPLCFEEPLRRIKTKAAGGERYFEGLIQSWLIDNPHRITVLLRPDKDLARKQEEEEDMRLEQLAALMTEAEREKVRAAAKALRAWQATPDSAEALAGIPRLSVADLPGQNSPIPSDRLSGADGQPPILFHPLPTNGIVYAEAAFDLSPLPEDLLPLLPLFGRALLEMGTARRDFVELNMAVAGKTGGMDADTLFLTHADTRKPVARLILSGKAAPDKAEELFSLMAEVLAESRFDDQERFLRMVLEEKARQEYGLVPAGHLVVATRLRAALSGAGRLEELSSGVSGLDFLRRLAEKAASDWPAVLQDMERLRRFVINSKGLALNLTATAEQGRTLEGLASALAKALPADEERGGTLADFDLRADLPDREALILPAQVNYVGKALNLFDAGYAWHGSAAVILKYLRTGYLWEKVRVQGGAYGCMCGLDRMSGAFTMVSYRDPNILKTLDVYDATGAFLAGNSLSREELSAAIVGAIGELDAYLLPDAKGSAAFTRTLNGDDAARRQELREHILGTTKAHVRQFGEALEAFSAKGRICALGGNALRRIAREKDWQKKKLL